MGMGLHLGEEIKYDPETGRKVTDSAWVREQITGAPGTQIFSCYRMIVRYSSGGSWSSKYLRPGPSALLYFSPFRERSFPPLTSVPTTFCFNRKLCQVPTFSHHVGAAHSILGILSSIAIGFNKLHSLQQSNSTDTTDQSSKAHRSQPLAPCTHKFLSSQAAAPAHTPACHRTPCELKETRHSGGRSGAGRSEASVPGASVSGKLRNYLKIVAHP